MQRPQGPPATPVVGVPYTYPPQPGEEFLLARLQRAQAMPPAQRSPEVAAFVEAMQLNEEACALLPLERAPGTDELRLRPALPATEATTHRVLLAALRLVRMGYVSGDHRPPCHKILHHLDFYLMRGCGAAYPPLERCAAELGALQQRNGGSAVGPYLWMYAAVLIKHGDTHLEKAAALRQLGDALAAADLGSLDRQLGELEGGAPTPSSSDVLITSRQLWWTCYMLAYHYALTASLNSDTALAARMQAHCASKMMQLEPLNLSGLLAEATVKSQPTLATKLLRLLQVYKEAKRQRHQLRSFKISGGAVMIIGGQLLASGGQPAISPSTARAAVEAFEEAEVSYLPIKRLLPALWVSGAAAMATVVRQAMPEVLRFIAEPGTPQQQPSSNSRHAFTASMNAMVHTISQQSETCCAGCGKVAQGLRKCSRCRQAGYCR